MEMKVEEQSWNDVLYVRLGINAGIFTTIILSGEERPKITVGQYIPVDVIWNGNVGVFWIDTYTMANGLIQFEDTSSFKLFNSAPEMDLQ